MIFGGGWGGSSSFKKGILRKGGPDVDYEGVLTLKQLVDWHRTLPANGPLLSGRHA